MTPTKVKDIKESLLQSPSGSWKVTNLKTPISLKRNLFPEKIDKSGIISDILIN